MERGLTWFNPARKVLGCSPTGRVVGSHPRSKPKGLYQGQQRGGGLAGLDVCAGAVGLPAPEEAGALSLNALTLAGTRAIGMPVQRAASGHFFKQAFSASKR